MNEIGEKILLLLLGGLAFGCCITPQKQWRVLKIVSSEWKRIDSENLRKGINNLYRYKFVSKNKNKDGSFEVLITEKGKLKALNCQLDNIKNKKEKWDGKWRMIAFDVPEKSRKGRNMLRERLRGIGFCELQKSVFITPYNCAKEMALFVKFYELGKYVRFGVLESVDNGDHFKKIFKL